MDVLKITPRGYCHGVVEAIQPPLPWPNTFRPGPWREWWDLCQDDATPEQRTAAWELFADHPMFEVLTVEVREG